MTKKSVFCKFIAALKKNWRETMPFISALNDARENLPKASTFYAGRAESSHVHVYLYFQHSSKAWQVGEFTINVVVAKDGTHRPIPQFSNAGEEIAEGTYRIGNLLEKKDKWWLLKNTKGSILTENWRAQDYADEEKVIFEAIKDVNLDVKSVLQKLGILERHSG